MNVAVQEERVRICPSFTCFVLFRPSTNWLIPTMLIRADLLYSVFLLLNSVKRKQKYAFTYGTLEWLTHTYRQTHTHTYNNTDNTNWCWGNTLIHYCKTVQPHGRIFGHFLTKLHRVLSYNHTTKYLSNWFENWYLHQNLNVKYHISFIHNCSKLEATRCPSIDDWVQDTIMVNTKHCAFVKIYVTSQYEEWILTYSKILNNFRLEDSEDAITKRNKK